MKPLWRITRRTDTYIEMTDINSGKMKTIPLATDAQWGYFESLREKWTKRPPLVNRPTVFQAKKGIEKLLAKQEKETRQTSLL